MLQIALVWAALGLLIGAFARLAGARSTYPRGASAWATLARWALPPAAAALAAVAGGWLGVLVVGRLAATAVALGAAALVTLSSALLMRRDSPSGASMTHDAPAP